MNFLFLTFYLQFITSKAITIHIFAYLKKKKKRKKKPEAAVLRCYTKQVLLKISQNSQENTYVGASFLINVF